MDVLRAVQQYTGKMVQSISGIKVLLLDTDTVSIISLASTTSSLLSEEVYLTDRIDNPSRERMAHLKCLCFLRPSHESLSALEAELARPRYGSYYLFFTNTLKRSAIERLAEADEHEVVREVQVGRLPLFLPDAGTVRSQLTRRQEYFADYAPLTPSHFSLNLLPSPLSSLEQSNRLRLYADTPTAWDLSAETGSFERHVDGLMALLLSLKKRPVIRYQRMSPVAKKLGHELAYRYTAEPGLFDFRPTAVPPVLLILDRRNDPVTPLLSQWTYQAMVHELIGISNGRVDLANAPDITDDLREIVLSPEQDPFFAKHLYDNFGDLGAHVKTYVSDYQARSSSNAGGSKIDTVADMKRFVEAYPEIRKLGGNVSKHVALVGELSRLVSVRRLLEVSEVEQSLATNESHASDLKSVQDLIVSPDTPSEAKLRLAILYALRYQRFNGNYIAQVVSMLPAHGVPESEAALVHVMLNFAGADQRQDDLFGREGLFSRGKSALKGLKGVDNVYTQHTPHLASTLDQLIRGRLRDTSYPFIDGHAPSPAEQQRTPTDVIVFIIGGTTYEEAKTIALLNTQYASSAPSASGTGTPVMGGSGIRFLLGGTGVLNSRTFLAMLRDAAVRFPATMHSSALSLRPTSNATSAPTSDLPLNFGNLKIGGVDVRDGVETGVEVARDAARSIMDRVRRF